MNLDGVQVSDVLGSNPEAETVDALVAGDVIPPQGPGGPGGRPAAERDEEVIDLLRDIREALTGGNDGSA